MKAVRRLGGCALGTLLASAIVLTAYPANRLFAQGFPTRPPRPARLAPVRFPPFTETRLANGLDVIVIEHHEQPVLSVSLSFRAGDAYDPAGKNGLAELVAELLSKGTGTRTAEQIAATIEGVGGSLSASSNQDFLTVSVDALSDDAQLAFDLLGDVTLHSTFPASELDLARTRALSALALQLSEPASLADRFFAQELYGRHPYARHPTAESYKAVTRDDVVTFAAQRLRPAGSLVVVAGDVTAAQVQDLIAKTFGSWRGAAPGALPPGAVPSKTATDVLLVHRPGSAQSNIIAGNTTILPTDPVYYAGRLVTQVLGGGADARLFLILREQKSWTYGAYAALRRYRGLGYWQATAEVRTEVTDSALAELLHQIDRIRTEVIPDSELAGAKGFLVGSFPLVIETPSQIAAQVANSRLLGLGDDYLRLYRERLSAVTALRARAAAQRLYRRRGLAIVVVGDATQVYDRLKTIAPVRVVDADGRRLTPADLAPQARPVALDPAQLVSRSDSSRVVVQGNPIGATVSAVRRTADSLVYTERSVLGGVFEQATTIAFDPADASVKSVVQVITQQGKKAETRLTYGDGRVKGHGAGPQPDGGVKEFDIDTAVAAGTYDASAVPVVAPALPLAPGQTFNLSFFSSDENTTKVLSFKVGAPEPVTVPAGTFQAYRVDVTGSRVPFVMYVTTTTPRRVVKTEFIGQPYVVELVK